MFTPGALQFLSKNQTNRRNGPKHWRRGVGCVLSLVLLVLGGLAPGALGASQTNRPPLPPFSSAAAGTNSLPSGLRDVKGLEIIPSGWAWAGRIALALVLAGLGWWAWQRWQKRAASGAAEPAIPPAKIARDRLREALALIDQPQPFCFAITEIIRTYLEGQFGLRATEQTTEEFLESLQDSLALDQGHKRVLEDFLTRCDLVKFGQGEPEYHELEVLHQSALRLVEETEFARPPQLVGGPPALPMSSGQGGSSLGSGASLDEMLTGDARYMPRETVSVGGVRGRDSSAGSKEAGA